MRHEFFPQKQQCHCGTPPATKQHRLYTAPKHQKVHLAAVPVPVSPAVPKPTEPSSAQGCSPAPDVALSTIKLLQGPWHNFGLCQPPIAMQSQAEFESWHRFPTCGNVV